LGRWISSKINPLSDGGPRCILYIFLISNILDALDLPQDSLWCAKTHVCASRIVRLRFFDSPVDYLTEIRASNATDGWGYGSPIRQVPQHHLAKGNSPTVADRRSVRWRASCASTKWNELVRFGTESYNHKLLSNSMIISIILDLYCIVLV
jgi:hypothetical protein